MKKTISLLGILLIAGCTIIPKADVTTATYNFSIESSADTSQATQSVPKDGKRILVPVVTAPLWLDSPGIHYRLAYHNTAQTLTYANSRWSSPPAFLLTQRIKEKIAADTHHMVIKDSSVATAEYELHIELEEFSHIFSSQTDSHVSVRFRVSVVNHAHQLVAQKTFGTTRLSSDANAAGAVKAFTLASNQLINELIEWLNIVIEAIPSAQLAPLDVYQSN